MTADKPTPVVPNLRFPEFRSAGDWHFQPLSDIAEPISERVGTSKCVPMSVTTGVGLLSQEEKFGRTIAGNSYKNYIRLQPNDFAYNKSATKAFPQGYIARYSDTRAAAVPNSIFTCFRPDAAAVIPEYLDHLLHGNHHGRWLRKYIAVGARAHGALSVSDDALMSMPVPLPPVAVSRPEQQKIADCHGALDDLIAAEGRKLEALRQHKQGLMQQLLPQPGETVPRQRFPEFHNDPEWEEKELGDVSEVLMCKRIFASETNPNGGVPFYKIGTLGGVPDAFISKDLFEEYKSKYNFPRTGEVLITCSGTVGKCLPYDGSEAYFQDSNIVWIDNSTLKVSNEFLLSILSNVNWSTLNSTTITRIYGPDLRGLAIKFPQNEKEQKHIADCLTSVDDLIAAQARKIDALKQQKQGLLQQLFPKPETA